MQTLNKENRKIRRFLLNYGWYYISIGNLKPGMLIRMWEQNDEPIIYKGKDRWVVINVVKGNIINIEPYIKSVN